MNTTEVQLLFRLLQQNERQAAVIDRLTRLLEELSHARSTVRPGAGAERAPAPTEYPGSADYLPLSGDPRGEDRAVRADLGRLDLRRCGEVRDRGAAECAPGAGGMVCGDLVQGGSESDGDAPDREPGDQDPGLRLCEPTGPAGDSGEGDSGRDPVAPGAGDTGDDRRGVGDGDTDARADCIHYASCLRDENTPLQLHACRYCGNYKPAAAAAVVATRKCLECGQVKPLDEYMPKGGRGGPRPGEYQLVCKACVLAKRRAHVAATAAEASVDSPAPAPPAPVVPRKVCTRCDKSRPVTDFAPYDGTIDHHDFLCSACRAMATAERAKWAAPRRRVAALDGVTAS